MDLNTILIIVGVVVLIALVLHGLWSNRREKSKYFQNSATFDRTSTKATSVEAEQEFSAPPSMEQPADAHIMPEPSLNETNQHVDYRTVERTVDDIKISIPNSAPAGGGR